MIKRLNAIAPYAGAKRQLAAKIVETLGEHQCYFEPFCGSASILLSKPKCRMEVVNDLNQQLIALARTIQDDELAPRLMEKLVRTLFCEEIYQHSCQILEGEANLDQLDLAYHYFVVSWMGRNGFTGTDCELTTGFCKRYTSGGGDPATRFRNVTSNIPKWWERLRNVTILSECGIKLIGRAEDKQGSVMYVDPPYFEKTFRYKHDFKEEDHVGLATALRRFRKTRVVLSYYLHPLLKELYLDHGWAIIHQDVQKNLSATRGPVKAPEVLLVNRV